MEVRDNGFVQFVRDKLEDGKIPRQSDTKGNSKKKCGKNGNLRSHLAQEPSNEISKDDGLVRLMIIWSGGNAGKVPEVTLPLVETGILAARVEEEDVGVALDEPATVEDLDACGAHGVEGSRRGRRVLLFPGVAIVAAESKGSLRED